jgi:hypothetical protein
MIADPFFIGTLLALGTGFRRSSNQTHLFSFFDGKVDLAALAGKIARLSRSVVADDRVLFALTTPTFVQ